MIITVDATIKNDTCVQKITIKMRRNERNLGLNIINGHPIFETLRKTHGYTILTRLFRDLHLLNRNGTPVDHLMRDHHR